MPIALAFDRMAILAATVLLFITEVFQTDFNALRVITPWLPAIFAPSVAISTSKSFLIRTDEVNAIIMGPAGYRVTDSAKSAGDDLALPRGVACSDVTRLGQMGKLACGAFLVYFAVVSPTLFASGVSLINAQDFPITERRGV